MELESSWLAFIRAWWSPDPPIRLAVAQTPRGSSVRRGWWGAEREGPEAPLEWGEYLCPDWHFSYDDKVDGLGEHTVCSKEGNKRLCKAYLLSSYGKPWMCKASGEYIQSLCSSLYRVWARKDGNHIFTHFVFEHFLTHKNTIGNSPKDKTMSHRWGVFWGVQSGDFISFSLERFTDFKKSHPNSLPYLQCNKSFLPFNWLISKLRNNSINASKTLH